MIDKLQVHHLRNLHTLSMQTGVCNVIIGANGSGKTSLLEAVFLLSRGKSFRQHQPKRYITHGQSATTLHGSFVGGDSMAVQKLPDAQTTLRLNGQNVAAQSRLTSRLPTLLIDPASMDMLDIGSGSRRQLLDWLTFHVKPEFHAQWTAYNRLLKQRNALLRHNKLRQRKSQYLSEQDRRELMAWDKGLANHASMITHYRHLMFEAWQPHFVQIISQLLPKYADELRLKFYAGYDEETSLDELLYERLTQDAQQGYTRIGAHRADVQVLLTQSVDVDSDDCTDNSTYALKNEPATHILSRGEKKLLITALKLSQLPVLLEQSVDAVMPVVLLDDITAELDDNALQILLSTLAELSCQVFITSLDERVLPLVKTHWQNPNLFHMKHGQLSSFLPD